MALDLVSLEAARQEFGGLIPGARYVMRLSRAGKWPALYRTGPRSPAFFKRSELVAFLAERTGGAT